MNKGFTIATVLLVMMAAIAAFSVYSTSGTDDVSKYLEQGMKLVYTVEDDKTETFYAQYSNGNFKAQWNHGSKDGDHSDVEEHHGGKLYTYATPNTDFLIAAVNGNSDLSAETKAELVSGYEATRGYKSNCVLAGASDVSASDIVQSDSGDVVKAAGMTLQRGADGTLTGVVSGDTVFQIVSIGPMSAAELASAFNGCSDSRELNEHTLALDRKLGWQETLSNTDWCGAGTDNCNTPCPEVRTKGNLRDNQACRRHDHGKIHTPAAFGLGVRLECGVDKDLVDSSNNWAVQAAFGNWGLAQTWGCENWQKETRCSWSCGWRGCRRDCWTSWRWVIKYGPFRYQNINHRGSTMYKRKCQRCTSDIW